MITCFYAYASQNPALVYTIQQAVKVINASSVGDVRITTWEELSVTGNQIIDEVCDAIDDAEVFLCDLTYLNANVLFELGYALINKKRIWVSIDTSLYEEEKTYKELRLLTTIGYAKFRNVDELVNAFQKDAPYQNLDSVLFDTTIDPIIKTPLREPTVFYLKANIPTQESIELSRQLVAAFPQATITDDSIEVSSRPLEWYVENVHHSYAVVAHFLDEKRDNKSGQNAKYAFICGMAHGIGKQLLMLAHSPYKPAIDYRNLMYVHDTPTSCTRIFDEWYISRKEKYEKIKKKSKYNREKLKATAALKRINLGEYVAEDEENRLTEYFINTIYTDQAIQTNQYKIFVGRKGSGKTANLYGVAESLQNQGKNRTHVCVIKPIDYELEGIFRLFQLSLPQSEQSNLVESLWKFLIYTELALSAYKHIQTKPVHYAATPEEIKFTAFIKDNLDLIEDDFTLRMERAIERVCNIDTSGNTNQLRQKVSEALHNTVLADLRRLLGDVFYGTDKVFVLIDNLDKAWEKRQDLKTLSHFLFGLLSVGQVIPIEFHRSDSKKKEVNLNLIVFLRSDIFHYIIQYAREKDKLKFTVINWSDPVLLQRIIEERFYSCLGNEITPDEIWERFFPPRIDNTPIKDYLVARIIPRPRDMIFLCKQALTHAISHGHTQIEVNDILQAEKDYSQHAWFALLAETEAQFEQIEELLIQFVGASEIVTREDITEFAKKSEIDSSLLDQAIELLCDATFLGLEVRDNQFEFLYDDRKKLKQTQARNVAERIGIERYKINIPFHAYLEINIKP